MEKKKYIIYLISNEAEIYPHSFPVEESQAWEMLKALMKSEGTISVGMGDDYWSKHLNNDGVVSVSLKFSKLISVVVIGPEDMNETIKLLENKYSINCQSTGK